MQHDDEDDDDSLDSYSDSKQKKKNILKPKAVTTTLSTNTTKSLRMSPTPQQKEQSTLSLQKSPTFDKVKTLDPNHYKNTEINNSSTCASTSLPHPPPPPPPPLPRHTTATKARKIQTKSYTLAQ